MSECFSYLHSGLKRVRFVIFWSLHNTTKITALHIFLLLIFNQSGYCGINEWTYVGLAPEEITSIAVHPTNPDIIYVAALDVFWDSTREGGLFKTTDRGLTWDTLGFRHTNVYEVRLDFTNPDIIWIANGINGVWKSTNCGSNWISRNDSIILGGFSNTGVRKIAVSPNNPSYLLCATKDDDGPGRAYYSTNGGENWIRSQSLGQAYPDYIEFDPNFAGQVYVFVSSNERVWLSTDYGITFGVIGNPHPLLGVYDVKFSMADTTEIWWATHTSGVIKSIDYGETWQQSISRFIDSDTVIFRLSLAGDTLLLLTNFGVFTTFNEGLLLRSLQQNLETGEAVYQGRIVNLNPLEFWVIRYTQGIWSNSFVDSSQFVSEVPDITNTSLKSIVVNPNPNNGLFFISIAPIRSEHLSIELFDILGRKIWSANEPASGFPLKVSLTSKVPSGIYFLRVNNLTSKHNFSSPTIRISIIK